eukprot:m.15214 g.15214  ORF g.15214 m.15214 type:complete len:192 (+) comp9581_c0_seq2:79-654(+)
MDNNELDNNQLLQKVFQMVKETQQEKPKPKRAYKKREYTDEERAKMKERLVSARQKAIQSRREKAAAKKAGVSLEEYRKKQQTTQEPEPQKTVPEPKPKPKQESHTIPKQEVKPDPDHKYNDLMQKYDMLHKELNGLKQARSTPSEPKQTPKPPPEPTPEPKPTPQPAPVRQPQVYVARGKSRWSNNDFDF